MEWTKGMEWIRMEWNHTRSGSPRCSISRFPADLLILGPILAYRLPPAARHHDWGCRPAFRPDVPPPTWARPRRRCMPWLPNSARIPGRLPGGGVDLGPLGITAGASSGWSPLSLANDSRMQMPLARKVILFLPALMLVTILRFTVNGMCRCCAGRTERFRPDPRSAPASSSRRRRHAHC